MSKAARANGCLTLPTCTPLTQAVASWLIPSNSSQIRRPAEVSRSRGSRSARRYHQVCRDSASGMRMLLKPATGSGR
jgi:hypothetical protein